MTMCAYRCDSEQVYLVLIQRCSNGMCCGVYYTLPLKYEYDLLMSACIEAVPPTLTLYI